MHDPDDRRPGTASMSMASRKFRNSTISGIVGGGGGEGGCLVILGARRCNYYYWVACDGAVVEGVVGGAEGGGLCVSRFLVLCWMLSRSSCNAFFHS